MLSLDSIFSNSSDIALCAFSFPFPWIRPKLCSICSFTFRYSCCRVFHVAYIWLHGYIVQPFGRLISESCLLRLLLTSHSSLLLRLMMPPARPHGISLSVFLRLPAWFTHLGYGCLSDFTAFSQLIHLVRLISGSCSSGYDFAIPSSRLHLTMQTLGVAMGFVGNYAPCGLSPQTDGMPVILKNIDIDINTLK